jgi:hypothetical protein
MPLSQIVAWYMMVSSSSSSSSTTTTIVGMTTSFYHLISAIAGFYCAWALYNRYLGGNVRELGQYSMGILTICTYYQKYIPSLIATTLVLSNFVLPSYFILFKWNATELARNVKNDTSSLAITWAVVFKLYFVSNILLWSFILYKFYTFRTEIDSHYTVLPIATNTQS